MADNTMKFLDLAGLQKLWARIGDVFVRKTDITDDLAKLEGIQAGAQVNKVEALQVTNGTDKLAFANDPENSTTWVIKNVTNLEDGQASILAPTAKAVKDAIDVVAKSVTDKNVSAEGDDYVAASAGSNKVTVSATEKTKAAIALAETALQKADITTGGANGTIAVDGADVAVKGLGSAAFTESTAYDAAGAATTAAAGALTSAQSYTDTKLSDLGLTKALGSAAFTESTAYATAAQGARADSALQEVIGSDYIAVAADKKTISANTGKVEDGANALAVASDVKTYVTNQINEVKDLVTASTQFLGVFTSIAEANAKSPAKGDIMAIAGAAEGSVDYDKNGKEFIYDGANWIELGDTTAEQKRLTALEDRADALETAVTTTIPGNIATAKSEAIADAKDYTDDVVGTLPTTGEGEAAKTMTVAEAIAAAEKSAKDHTNGLVGNLGESATVKDYVDAAKDAAKDHTNGLVGTLPEGSDTVVAAINAAKEAAINAAAGNITQDAANAELPTGAFNLVSEVSKDGKTVAAKYYTFEKISDAEIAALE